jgi:hypothetical protein
VRIAELKGLEEQMEMPGFGADVIKADVDRHMISAIDYKKTAQLTLALLQEMRKPEDPVS